MAQTMSGSISAYSCTILLRKPTIWRTGPMDSSRSRKCCSLVHGLTHYGKLSFDCPAEHAILHIVREIPPLNKLDDGPARIGDVPQVDLPATPRHRGFLAALRSPA